MSPLQAVRAGARAALESTASDRTDNAERMRNADAARWVAEAVACGVYYREHGTPRPQSLRRRTPDEALLCAIFGEPK